MAEPIAKVYLGDSVYAKTDGIHIVLYTDNGFMVGSVIYIDGGCFEELVRYASEKLGWKVEVTK